MNLEDQTINNQNQINLTDSLNSLLMELKIKRTSSAGAPETNELNVYVDKQSKENPTEERKQYLFDLLKPLSYLENISDEFIMKFESKNGKIVLETMIKRLIGENEEGEYLLDEPIYEILDNSPIVLFSGVNYIYTNYENTDITLIYPKDNSFNKLFLNNAIYLRDNGDREECTLEDIYYSNCFTKTEDRIDLEVGHITTDCVSSSNNKFSLDEDGNLIVNTITVADPISSTDLLSIYPVGSIYMSVNNTNPSNLFGGVWEQIKDRFLLACGDTHTNGSTGGEESHKLTVNEMPSHTHTIASSGAHTQKIRYKSIGRQDGGYWTPVAASSVETTTSSFTVSSGAHTHTPSNTGGNALHNNMPPYLAVYVWKRIE